MKQLTWKPILFNLHEAYEELDELHCRLHFLAFGDMPEDCPDEDGSNRAWIEARDKRHPFTEFALHVSLAHTYHHLNFAWNIRRTPEEHAWHFATQDFLRWSLFPRTEGFADLWLAKEDIPKAKREPGFARINFALIQAFILPARRQLGILCHLVAKELGEYSRWSLRPDGLNEDVGAHPLTEKEFAERMHSIYELLNQSWNGRKDKAPVTRSPAIRRRKCFSPIFMS